PHGRPAPAMRFLVCATAAALAAAVLLPGAPLGIGVPLVAALVAAAVARRGAWPLGIPALLLTAAPALRDAGWVVALDLAAAVLLASIALAGGETLAQLARGAVSFVTRLPAARLPVPLRSLGPTATGLFAGGILVVPFGLLFWSADGAFAELAGRAVPTPGRVTAFVLVAVVAVGLSLAREARREGEPEVRFGRRESTIALGLLAALFLAFVLVQLTVLFGGHDHVLRTAHLTYA